MANNSHSHKLTPVKLHRVGDVALPTTSLGKSTGAVASNEPAEKHEPEARLVEVQPGIYDIMVTCSCGEQMVVRCESITPSPTASKSTIYTPKDSSEAPPTPTST